ncbi:MAG: HlyD family efflux transporter periplasmic adaptor subunit [Planctomycetaceae bacterium]
MARKGYKNQNEVEASRIAAKQAELDVEVAEGKLKVLEDFTRKRTEAELKAKAKDLEAEVARVKLQNDAEMAKVEKARETRQQTLDSEREILKKLREQIEACTLRAPQDGQVAYANNSSSRRSDGSGNIELGAQVRERQAIINLPDTSRMKVDCRVHESMKSALKEGLPARVRVVSFPEEIFNGTVSSVSSVAVPGNWPNTDLREYKVEITLTDDVEQLRRLAPGLTAMVELIVENRKNVLQMPIQALVTIGTDNFTYRMTANGPERISISIGANNSASVEILGGLEEGDEVVQNPRTAFAEEIERLEAEAEAANSREAGEFAPTVTQTSGPDGAAARGPRPGGTVPGGGVPAGAPGGGAPARANNDTGGGPPGGGRPSPEEMISRSDTDGDGKLSVSEIKGPMASNFGQVDSDGDGFVTATEIRADFATRDPSAPPTGQ